ncbi:hypothetical protein AAC387_Pa02g2287 [Persea americana]
MKQKTSSSSSSSSFYKRKHFRWLLWFSLSLYFFTSYYPTSKTTANNNLLSPSKTKPSSSSRALIETPHNITPSKNPQVLSTQPLVSTNMKLYVYDLPSKYNRDWLSNERCNTHLFAAEVAIHEALSGSGFRTLDPWEADFFFVPVYVSCNFSTVNGFPAIGHARPLMASAVQRIASAMPFWNRSGGSDHVFVATHDFGACFHTMEHVAIADGVPEFLKKSIILQTFGVRSQHPCQDVENVVIPPYVSPEMVRSTLEHAPEDRRRDIWVFFRGKMEVHPKNVSGHFYSNQVRTEIWNRFNLHRKFYLKRKRFAGYQSEIARSVFCLCPLGWAPWSPRLVESVALGCVPVIIADGIRLPFPSSVLWPEISLTVAEHDVGNLDRILEHVAATNLSIIQRNLWDPANGRSLLFNRQIQVGDATWQVLDALSGKLHRSFRRSGEDHVQQGADTWL